MRPQEASRHLEIIRGLVQPEVVDDQEELIGDPGDRNVRDLELFLPQEVEQKVEGTREGLEFDHEGRRGTQRRGRRIRQCEGGRLFQPSSGSKVGWTGCGATGGARNNTPRPEASQSTVPLDLAYRRG